MTLHSYAQLLSFAKKSIVCMVQIYEWYMVLWDTKPECFLGPANMFDELGVLQIGQIDSFVNDLVDDSCCESSLFIIVAALSACSS